MLKNHKNAIRSNSLESRLEGSVKIDAGSFVIDNQWVSYNNYLFRMSEYIGKIITPNRPSLFFDRNNAMVLVICLSLKDGIKIIEGKQVKFSYRESVPFPDVMDSIPLVGIIIRQDGTTDLTNGYVPITDDDLMFFSGTGNIENKNLIGITGATNYTLGSTGIQGETGPIGYMGVTGPIGDLGTTGATGELLKGEPGIKGMTGISWDVHLLFSDTI